MLHRRLWKLCLGIALMGVIGSVYSAFHLWQITEVYSNASGTVQYIELTALTGGQQFVNSTTIAATSTYPFPNALPGDTTGKKMLIGTAGFAALNVVTPDFTVPNGFLALTNGTILFAGGFDSFSYAALPTDGILSLNRDMTTAVNSPTNFAGQSGTIQPPTTPPGAPSAPTVTAGLGQVIVTFTSPSDTGSSPITAYTATCGAQSMSGANSPLVVSNLPAGIAVTCTVLATNGQGNGPASPPSASVTPLGVPGAPVISNAAAGDGQAVVDFQAPGNTGGSAITGYTANCGGQIASGAGSPLQVFGLANGVQVACTVFASNAQGNSLPSAAVNVIPAGNPGTPTNVAATRGDRQATITFTASQANGSAIQFYTVTCNGGSAMATGQNSPIVVTGLTNGTTYSCAVFATNGIGNSAASSPPVSVIPAGVPGAPANVSVSSNDAQAMIIFDAPANTGGSPILLYTATCNPGSHTASGLNLPLIVTGLTNGAIYACSVTAANGVGTGPASTQVTVTPARAPDPPVIGTPIAGNAQVSIAFSPPAFNGGSPITGYAVTCTPSGTGTGQNSPITITGLANDTMYTCSVNAGNAVSFGAPSATVSVTPVASPALTLVSVRSRKVHGAAGPFDLPIETAPTIAGNVTVEPRLIGSGYTLLFEFNDTIVNPGSVSTFDADGNPVGTSSLDFLGKNVLVTLLNIPDRQRLIVQLAGVNGNFSTNVALGFLAGDVNNSYTINASDIIGIKVRNGSTANNANYRFDLNASGVINQADISVAKARSGSVLAVPAVNVCIPNPCTTPPPGSCAGGVQTTYANPGVCTPTGLPASASCSYAPVQVNVGVCPP